ncbi:MAG TPA: nucleoid-associated protein, partial [Candidatus Saccharimonadales bacterium]|nr:nucleoid-associated protein [Candidatus Saccharimonadales bacterium]
MGEDKVVMVERSIVHLIHHLDEKLTPSDDELDLAANDKLREYFNDQVKNALGDPQTASARFSTDDDQSAITQCYRILGNPSDFIPASRELARLLMKAMGTDARIKPDTATIATCIYTDDSQSGTKFLALIKLDPSVGFVEKVVPVKGGGQIVTFDVVNNVMPTKEVKLRKAALIPPKGTVPNLDLYLLDRQAVGVAANFFGKTFLNTVFALDPVASVKTFFSAADKTRRTLMKAPEGKPERIGPNESDAFVRHFENALLKGHVNKRKFVEDAPLPPEGKKLLKKHLDKQFAGDTQIKLDRKYARDEFLTKIRYRGDRAFLLEFEAAHEK